MNKIFGLAGPVFFVWILFTQLFDPYTPSAAQTDQVSSPSKVTTTAASDTPSDELRFPVADHGMDHIISYFGDARGKTRKHKGVDIKAPRHTPVLAVIDGRIEAVREGGNGGRTVYLRGVDGVQYFYAHLEDWLVAANEEVDAGQAIATVGNSGNASRTIPHLHFEIITGKERTSIDPLPYLERAR